MKHVVAFIICLSPLAALGQDEAPAGRTPKPKPKPIGTSQPGSGGGGATTGGGSGTTAGSGSSTPTPAPVAAAVDLDWRDTHRVKLRNGMYVDGVYDEKESSPEIVILKYSSSTEVSIPVEDIATDTPPTDKELLKTYNDRHPRPGLQIVKITIRNVRDDGGLVPRDPGPGPGPGPNEKAKLICAKCKKESPAGSEKCAACGEAFTKIEVPPPTKFGPEARAKVNALIASLQKESNKQPYMEQLARSGQDCLLYAVTLVPDLDDSTATWCFAAFGKAKDDRIMAELRKLPEKLKNTNTLVALLNFFGAFEDKRAAPIIAKLVGHPDEGVRYSVVDNLNRVGDAKSIEAIAGLTVDANKQVRMRAGEVIVELAKRVNAQRDALAALRTVLRKAKPDSIETVAVVMGELGQREASQPLTEMTNNPAPAVRLAAVTSLGKLKATEALDRLLSMLSNEKEKEIRAVVAEAIKEIGDQTAIPRLINAMKTEKEDSVLFTIQRVLRQMTGQNFGPKYEEWKAWLDSRPK